MNNHYLSHLVLYFYGQLHDLLLVGPEKVPNSIKWRIFKKLPGLLFAFYDVAESCQAHGVCLRSIWPNRPVIPIVKRFIIYFAYKLRKFCNKREILKSKEASMCDPDSNCGMETRSDAERIEIIRVVWLADMPMDVAFAVIGKVAFEGG